MKQLLNDIQTGTFHQVYLLYGEERYLVRFYRDKLKKAVLQDDDEMNYAYFYGNDIDWNEVSAIADTLPFFQEYRFILIEESHLLKKANDFSDYLKNMPDTTIILFVEREVDKRNKLYKYIKKEGLAVELSAMNVADTKKFVAVKLKERGFKIRESTADYLLEQVENSLTNLENEIEKLAAYAKDRDEITPADIDAVCCLQVTGKIFQLMDAVASNDSRVVFSLYRDLLTVRESPMSILYLLNRHFNILLQVKEAGNKYARGELAQKIGIPPFALSKYQAQSRNFSSDVLKEMLEEGLETEYRFKQGRLGDQMGVELLLISFTKRRERKK